MTMKKTLALILAAGMVLAISSCGCEHEWSEATCTSVSTCALCETTEGEMLPHDFEEASCTTVKTCKDCGLTEGEELGHDYEDATCTTAKTCKRCGETVGKALGHNWLPPTSCVTPNECSVCKAKGGARLSHEAGEWTTVIETTCTEVGKATSKCVKCGTDMEKELELAEHTLGEWVITKVATIDESGEKQAPCTVCGNIAATEEYDLTPEEVKAAYVAQCKKYNYKDLERNPNTYMFEHAKFYGRVVQVMQDVENGKIKYQLRVATRGGYDVMYVVYSEDANSPRILEDDYVDVYGVLAGSYTYETVRGDELTIPLIYAKYVDIK